jgi:hypothetical protein
MTLSPFQGGSWRGDGIIVGVLLRPIPIPAFPLKGKEIALGCRSLLIRSHFNNMFRRSEWFLHVFSRHGSLFGLLRNLTGRFRLS